MKLKKIIGVSVVTALLCLMGCTNKNETSEHEAVTILAPYLECDRLADLVHEKYPEVNLEIFSYSGANITQYLQNMLAADDLPDICTQTVYLYLRKERRKGKNNFSYEKESENDRGKYLPKDHFFCNSIVSGKSVSAIVQYC